MAVSKTPRAVPEQLKGLPLFLSIDDTMVEKESEKFELHSRLFDHTAHNGSNYLDGHCMVASCCRSLSCLTDPSAICLSRWATSFGTKKQTKLEIAAGMVRRAMGRIGPDRQVFLLCDSWYPKRCVASLVDEFPNLDVICNARIDIVIYDLPPKWTVYGR